MVRLLWVFALAFALVVPAHAATTGSPSIYWLPGKADGGLAAAFQQRSPQTQNLRPIGPGPTNFGAAHASSPKNGGR